MMLLRYTPERNTLAKVVVWSVTAGHAGIGKFK
jgi:hypothetical protein